MQVTMFIVSQIHFQCTKKAMNPSLIMNMSMKGYYLVFLDEVSQACPPITAYTAQNYLFTDGLFILIIYIPKPIRHTLRKDAHDKLLDRS